ncbi:MAG: Fe-S cluster protein, partial [Deltaproteobacteria bacterium]|nr:Fe-S cluster protein [Deltaproteobacteria bacterium]
MAKPENVMQVFSLLDKSNCRKCGEKTCLAFAGMVYQGRRSIYDCPVLDPAVAARFLPEVRENDVDDSLEDLKQMVANSDLKEAAERIG